MKRGIAVFLALLAGLCGLFSAAAERADYAMPYYIEVDITNQIVTVYDAETGAVARQMICSTGRNEYTPQGVYILPEESRRSERGPWYYIAMYRRFVKYATRIRGEILFHSLPYYGKSLQAIDAEAASQLGTPASHGCIRLRWQDAEFIALNCLPGTAVRIFKSENRDDGLRELLLQGCYDAASGLSYQRFMGVSDEPGALGRNSAGPEVLDLQYRLRDLGLYDGELNGVYGSATVNAVRQAQYLLGADMSGAAGEDLRKVLFGPDAPTAMNVKLSPGMSGPAVRALQDNLAALKLYEGAPDGVYDGDVSEAVKRFQRAYCYDDDGEAPPEVQKAAAHESGRLREVFGGGDYGCEQVTEAIPLARVEARAGAKLRERPSQESRQVKRLPRNALLVALEPGKNWSRVRSGDDEGYVKNSLVRFGEREVSRLKYAAPDGTSYAVGNSAADYLAGARLPCDVFAELLAAADQGPDMGNLADFVTVDTRGEGASLNLREAADADSTVLDTVPDGESLRVRRRGADWTLVRRQGREGYLLNKYLKFWTGPDDALDDGDEAGDEAAPAAATVKSASRDEAAVYAEDADDARVLGHLADGLEVEILEVADGWCRIRYQGREGWMIAEDLSAKE